MVDKRFTAVTSRQIKYIIPAFMQSLGRRHQERPDLILASWDDLVGERIAPMTRAASFNDGILTVKVQNSTLLSLLSQHEKPKLLKRLREKFPSARIRNIRFCIG